MPSTIDDHAAPVLVLLDAGVTGAVYDGKVPSPAPPVPYVVAYFSASWPDLSFQGVRNAFQLRMTLHCVAGTARAARMVADEVQSALLDVTPTVAGRACHPIRWEDSAPPQRDESTGVLVMDAIDVYTLLSEPG
jgi:hypothetical protein